MTAHMKIHNTDFGSVAHPYDAQQLFLMLIAGQEAAFQFIQNHIHVAAYTKPGRPVE